MVAKDGSQAAPPPSSYDTDTETEAELLSTKTLSLGILVNFYKKHEKKEELNIESTCQDVIENIIVPLTKKEEVCYADISAHVKRKADFFVCYWHGMKFRDLILSCAQAVTSVFDWEVLDRRVFTTGLAPGHLDRSFWLGMFAYNYHQKQSCKPILTEAVVGRSQRLLVALDRELGILRRLWCAVEVYEASQAGVPVKFVGHPATGYQLQEEDLEVPNVEQMKATASLDVEALLDHCDRRKGGWLNVSDKVKELWRRGLLNTAFLRAVRGADLEAMKSLLELRADVNETINWAGDTVLTWALQKTQNDAVIDLILDAKADPHSEVTGHWTPLHFAVQLGREAALPKLLAMRADPTVAAQNGRTPLLEAAERGEKRMVELLLDAGADPSLADNTGVAAVFFAPSFDDEELCDRLGWHCGMRTMNSMKPVGDSTRKHDALLEIRKESKREQRLLQP